MGSRRAARPSRSHARPHRGLGRRGTAVVLGVAVTAGVGITLAVSGGEDDGPADRVTTSAAGGGPNAEVAAGGATAPVSPSASASASPRVSATPSASPSRTARASAAPAKKTPAASTAPARATVKTRTDGSASGGGGTDSGGGPGSGSGPASVAGSGSGGASGAEAQVLALVNKERASAGCSPVTANDRLTRAADDYSDVMAASGVMSHTGPDGSTMTTRVEAAGYEWSTLGENIARGQADAASVMESWMNSPGHRANILNCSFEELGVGVHFGDGGPWWTQDFGASR
ncbi:CAP domain-containing protein [Streptomyces sp. NPDC032940]|uniref:CAP domain-containing protein n=1 Tax=Streptomyces sp. NPDC032940 TaxID=3155366 RepID=UPI00340DC74A